MYTAIATIFHRFGDKMRLYETSQKNVAIYHDFLVPFPQGLDHRVRVTVGK